MNTTPLTLKKIRAAQGTGSAAYTAENGRYRVVCHTGRTWSGRLGSHATTQWVALDLLETPSDPSYPYVAQGDSLAALRRRLASYIRDRAAGCARHPYLYTTG